MQYVIKSEGQLVGNNGRTVKHFNDAVLLPTREQARWFIEDYLDKSKQAKIYRVKVKPVEFVKVR